MKLRSTGGAWSPSGGGPFLAGILPVVLCGLFLSPVSRGAEPAQTTFRTPEEASEALIRASESFDVPALMAMLGPEGADLVVTGDPVLDRNQTREFAAEARVKSQIAREPGSPIAVLLVGAEDWPVPIPIVEEGGTWRFDSAAGRTEVLYRRIGRNELDAIEACENYVDAQREYASERRAGSSVNQYAQRVISTPGKQDGLVWRAPDGTFQGPLAEGLAGVIAEGYTDRYAPFHGYYFKILKAQGPAAPGGEIDFVVNGVMIGGFALVAAPAEYEVTGVKTFIVSSAGVVYEKDLGPNTLEQFRAMEHFNPDPGWQPVAMP